MGVGALVLIPLHEDRVVFGKESGDRATIKILVESTLLASRGVADDWLARGAAQPSPSRSPTIVRAVGWLAAPSMPLLADALRKDQTAKRKPGTDAESGNNVEGAEVHRDANAGEP